MSSCPQTCDEAGKAVTILIAVFLIYKKKRKPWDSYLWRGFDLLYYENLKAV
jgi:hypothetical protein